jgi:hypothetical protein
MVVLLRLVSDQKFIGFLSHRWVGRGTEATDLPFQGAFKGKGRYSASDQLWAVLGKSGSGSIPEGLISDNISHLLGIILIS